jgi:chromosome segregation ATPase
MEMDQILKRVQWMDDERRKDKDTIALMENRILKLEGGIDSAHQLIKEMSGEVSRLSAVVNRMDQYDQNLLLQRVETKKMVEELDKDVKKREEEAGKVQRVVLRDLESKIEDVKKELDPLPRYEKAIGARVEEDIRLGRAVDELRVRIDQVAHTEDEYTRTFRLLEDGRRQDAKRINDLIGEVSALRKRADDSRGQVELINNNIRRLETRLQELVAVESERRDSQSTFLDRQNLLQVERDRVWKDWESRFKTIESEAADIESHVQKLEITHRDTRRSQQMLEELSAKVERRISEITEIQRLSEDRFRQEWVTFKADDQKRWTNYTLIQEESRGENSRQLEKLTDRITDADDILQEQKDIIEQINEQNEKQLQSLLALVHDWVTEYERTVGSSS